MHWRVIDFRRGAMYELKGLHVFDHTLRIVNQLRISNQYDERMRPDNDNIRSQLGRRIRYLRERRGLSQRTFCMMIGMDRTYLIAVEHGTRNIAIDNLSKIADGLNVTLSELFEGITNEPPAASLDNTPHTGRTVSAD